MSNKRSWSKRSTRNKSTAKKVKSLDRKVKKIENDFIELKYVAGDINNTAVGDDLADLYTFSVAQGDTVSTRSGNMISPTSIRLCGSIFTNSNATTPTVARMILFWDSQPNGANPPVGTANSLLQDLASGLYVNELYDPDNRERYKVLLDKRVVLNPLLWLNQSGFITDNLSATATISTDVDGTVPVQKLFNEYVKLGRNVKFTGTTDGIADITKNALHLYLISDQPTDSPTIQFSWTMFYRDA